MSLQATMTVPSFPTMPFIKDCPDEKIRPAKGSENALWIVATSFGNVDRDGDRMLPGCIDTTDFDKHPIAMLIHDYQGFGIGRIDDYKTEGDLFLMKVVFPPNNYAGEWIYELYEGGTPIAWSIGFELVDCEIVTREDGKRGRDIKKLKLWEVSAVPMGANPEAVTLGIAKGVLNDDQGAIIRKSIANGEAKRQMLKRIQDQDLTIAAMEADYKALAEQVEAHESALKEASGLPEAVTKNTSTLSGLVDKIEALQENQPQPDNEPEADQVDALIKGLTPDQVKAIKHVLMKNLVDKRIKHFKGEVD